MSSNADDVARRIEGATLQKRRAIKRSIKEIERNAKRRSPAVTGRLRRNIISFMSGDLGVVGVSIAAEHALAIHGGSGLYGPKKKKYEIAPKYKKALSWPGLQKSHAAGNSARPFVPKVMHPGVKPQPFLQWGFDESEAALKKIVEDEGLEFVRSMA